MKEAVIIGNGKLVQAVLHHFHDYSSIPVRQYQSGILCDESSIFIHLGSGRQYGESLNAALKTGSSYIQGATEKDIVLQPPSGSRITFIEAPNLDIKIIKLFHLLKNAGDLFKDETKSIIESHQEEKLSQPGTAYKFCEFLNIPREEVVSIRNPQRQSELGIKNLKNHAYHKIELGEEGSRITIETRVEGLLSYVKGLAAIAECIPGLQRGNYSTGDLVEMGLI